MDLFRVAQISSECCSRVHFSAAPRTTAGGAFDRPQCCSRACFGHAPLLYSSSSFLKKNNYYSHNHTLTATNKVLQQLAVFEEVSETALFPRTRMEKPCERVSAVLDLLRVAQSASECCSRVHFSAAPRATAGGAFDRPQCCSRACFGILLLLSLKKKTTTTHTITHSPQQIKSSSN